MIDHDTPGTPIVSSGFFNGFSQEAKDTVLFIMFLLFAGIVGAFAYSRLMSEGFPATEAEVAASSCVSGQGQSVLETRKLAIAYHAKKYNDANVGIDVMPLWNLMKANVGKNALVVNKLSDRGYSVTENETGFSDKAFELLTLTFF